MKIRYLLENDHPDTIAKHQAMLLEANPDCTIDGININPLNKNEQREGEFEVDFILSHTDEKQVENAIKAGLEQLAEETKIQEVELIRIAKERDDKDKEIKRLEKELTKKNAKD